MMVRDLTIDGRALGKPTVGFGVYTYRLASAIWRRREELDVPLRILAPACMRRAVSQLPLPPDSVRFIAAPRVGHGLLDHLLWQQWVGAGVSARGSALFSPSPFWSVLTPGRMAIAQHDLIYRRFPQYLGSRGARRWLARRAESTLARSTFVVTGSEHAGKDLAGIRGLDRSRVRVIQHWLPAGFTPENAVDQSPSVRRRYGLPDRLWLYIGGYDCRKNVEHLVRVYARFASRAGTPPLVLAGRMPHAKGPYCDIEGALRTAGLGPGQVVRPGTIAPGDLPGLYGAAELLIYPSVYEGFGLPPMEAMGCGCPAICADNSSLPEVVGDRDYRFATDDDEALASLLERALPARLPMNPSFRRDRFDEQTAMTSYAHLFNQLVET